MTLIDTSAWIEFFRPKGDPLIATVAHAQHLPLLAKDAHFEAIRELAMPELKILSPN